MEPDVEYYKNCLDVQKAQYLKALEMSYQLIILVNPAANSVQCIYGRDTSPIGYVFDIEMTVEGAIDFWVKHYMVEEDKERTFEFFNKIIKPEALEESPDPLMIEVSLKLRTTGQRLTYLLAALYYDEKSFLLCAMERPGAENGSYNQNAFTAPSFDRATGEVLKTPRIRTFGYFDVYIDNNPLYFTNSKEKELLAILVDRRGGTVSSEEAISLLWEDEPLDAKIRTRYRKLALSLKRTLEHNNIGHIIRSESGIRNINPQYVDCDYYDFLAGKPNAVQDFHDLYMTNYSWAEETLSTLMNSQFEKVM